MPTESRRVKTNAGRVDGMTTVERHILDYGGALIPGCYDALSARIMAKQGYKVRNCCNTRPAFVSTSSCTLNTYHRLIIMLNNVVSLLAARKPGAPDPPGSLHGMSIGFDRPAALKLRGLITFLSYAFDFVIRPAVFC